MEYAEGGDLSTFISKQKHLSEDIARRIFQQIIDGIYYLHQIGICHRNLKLENILFSSNKRDTIKIINFGKSNLYLTGVNSKNPTLSFGAEFLETPFGIREYTPPEVILGCKYDGLLLDIWFCGIILYVMLFGTFPFEDKNEDKLYTKIIKGEFSFPKNIHISEEAKLLIKKILVVNPRLRSNFNDIRTDTWFMKDYEQVPGLFISIRNIPISDSIIEEMVKLGFQKNEIIKNIKNNKHNNITTFYYLLVNKLRAEGISNISDLISNDFMEYLREQDLKNNLIKKGEKPISLKIMKSNSKPIFPLNDSVNNEQNKDFDLDYFKSIFQDYYSDEKIKPGIKKKINIKDLNKDKKGNINNGFKKRQTKNKRAKSQNDKKLKEKNIIINKDRNSYSTSLSKMHHEKNNINKIKENEENKVNSKIKQIKNIKEIIRGKNRTISNNDLKNSILTTSKLNPSRNHLVINSFSNSRNKKNSLIINKNIYNNIINEPIMKMNKIKQLKEKNVQSNNIKNLSLKNIYYKEYIYKDIVSSRNKFSRETKNESKTTRTFKQKNTKSSSSSKSKSLKSKSNYSTEKGETIFSEKHSKTKKKENYFNIKINIIKPNLLKKSLSKEKELKRKNIEKKSKSTSFSNNKKRTNIHEYSKNKSKNNPNNNKNSRDDSKITNQRKVKEKKLSILISKNRTTKNKEAEKIYFQNNSSSKNKNKNKDKIIQNSFENLLINKNKKSNKDNKLKTKRNLSNINGINESLEKHNNKSLNIYHDKIKNSNRITNIRKASPQKEKDKKNDKSKKNKIKEIKAIQIRNIPKNTKITKTENNLKPFFLKEDKKGKLNHKNRMVINFKKFSNG